MKTIPISKFGKDHWSLLAYIGCRCVDNEGTLNKEHLRVNIKTHPQHSHRGTQNFLDVFPYPTRLAEGKIAAKGHDDWDCLDDLEKAGLIKLHGTGLNPVYAMTVKGWEVDSQIRQFKATGGTFATFKYEE